MLSIEGTLPILRAQKSDRFSGRRSLRTITSTRSCVLPVPLACLLFVRTNDAGKLPFVVFDRNLPFDALYRNAIEFHPTGELQTSSARPRLDEMKLRDHLFLCTPGK